MNTQTYYTHKHTHTHFHICTRIHRHTTHRHTHAHTCLHTTTNNNTITSNITAAHTTNVFFCSFSSLRPILLVLGCWRTVCACRIKRKQLMLSSQLLVFLVFLQLCSVNNEWILSPFRKVETVLSSVSLSLLSIFHCNILFSGFQSPVPLMSIL